MNIEVAKQDLEAALKVVSTTVGSGSDLSSHYLFRVREGKAEVLSYDMRVFSLAPFTATIDGEDGDAFTVEAWRLDKWISSVGDGVLTLGSDKKGEVIAKGPRSRVKLRSLDASRFPFWDGLLSDSASMGSVSPGVLYREVNFSKNFVSADDTNRPELCQIEAVDGLMQATNRRAVSCVTVRDLPDLALRVPGKDIPTMLRFLSDKNTQENGVDLLQAVREGNTAAIILRRPDGSYVGFSRPTAALPKLPVDVEKAEVTMTLNIDEFMDAVAVLLSSAPKGQETVTFSSKDGSLVVSMPSDAGGVDEYPLVVSQEDGLGEQTFALDYSYIKSIADQFDLDDMLLGVHRRGRGGYVSFMHEDDATNQTGNQYHTVIVWHA